MNVDNKQIVGSKWWKFDFHNHTPLSDDYGKGTNQEQDKLITPKEWLLNYMRAGIDCVAVTDHNSGVWVDTLKSALDELTEEDVLGYRPLYIFPGVELTVQGNIHILAIFSCETTTSDIDTLLGAVGYRGTKGGSDDCTERPPTEVITEIIASGGIAIPAHVDQVCGLFETLAGNTLEQVLDHKGVFSMEVTDHTFTKPEIYNSKKLDWAEVLSTDSHHPSGVDGQRYPGSHFTWVKMSAPSLDGLRLALLDGPLSLKRSDQFPDDPNIHGPLIIENITVDEAKYLGRGGTYSCQLNPWLNTIIGGRGTGKSTSLEFLRIALKRKDELPRNLKSDFIKYGQVSRSRNDEGLLKENTTINIGFQKDGGRFRISWSNADDNFTIEEEISPDQWEQSEGDIAQRFPVRIYSQKQIFELAKHPHALLKIVDDAPEVDFRSWELERNELTTRYLSIQAQAREVAAGLQEESVVRGQLEDVKRKLKVFEESGHADVLKTFQLRKNQSKAIDTWEKTWEGTAESVLKLADELIPSEIDLQYFENDTDENKELLEAATDIKTQIKTIQTAIKEAGEQIGSIRESWLSNRNTLKISSEINEANDEYKKLLDELSDAGAGDPSAYGGLVTQLQSLKERLLEFDTKRETLSGFEEQANEILEKINNHRADISNRRENFLEQTLNGNQYVQIKVLPFGNIDSLEEQIRGLIGRASGFDRDIGAIGNDEGLLTIFSDKSLSSSIEERTHIFKSRLIGIHNNEESAITNARDNRFVTHIQALTPEQLDHIVCWFPDDSLEVKYSLKNGDDFRPVEQGSPGQKTAALLAFILSYGDEPLILDQPEDDLDTLLINDLIVTQLREIKQRRQVLVVTHNPNIVVNGDAENVVALDVVNGRTQIVTQGSLQDCTIRNEICRVMEGGEEAFSQRYKRITAGQR